MPLQVYHGNRVERLVDALVPQLAATPALSYPWLVVPDIPSRRLLEASIAQRQGQCSQIRWLLAEHWLTALVAEVEGRAFTLDDQQRLAWYCYQHLATATALPEPLASAWTEAGDAERWMLAEALAGTFDQLLDYDPERINRWQTTGEDSWLAATWQALGQPGMDHRLAAWQRLAMGLADRPLPQPLIFFGLSRLSSLTRKALTRLADHATVQLYLLDCTADRAAGTAAAGDSAVGNLLALWSTRRREALTTLLAQTSSRHPLYTVPLGDKLLMRLQRLLLYPRLPQINVAIAERDRSLQVHVCHSPRREVEVLYDQLLAEFQADPTLSPAEVLVLVPEPERYAPLIESVFATAEGDRYIPFAIANSGQRHRALFHSFLELLALASSRYRVSQVLRVLQNPAIRQRFNLDQDDVALIRQWVNQAGIRWGIDGIHRQRWGLDCDGEHTWRQGLERLLLGLVMAPGDDDWLGIAPWTDLAGDEAMVLGRWVDLAEALFELADTLAAPRPAAQWMVTLADMAERFFASRGPWTGDLDRLDRCLRELAAVPCEQDLPLATIRQWLSRRLLESRDEQAFASGGVTFADYRQPAILGYRVVAMLGLDAATVSRRQLSEVDRRLTLIPDQEPATLPGERLLDALNSAQQGLWLSYVGRDLHDHRPLPAATALEELLLTIDRLWSATMPTPTLTEQLVTVHPLQAFSPRYFQGSRRWFSFSEELSDACRWAQRGRRDPQVLVERPLPPPGVEWSTVDLHQLIRFLGQPTRFLLRERLGIHVTADSSRLMDQEPFTAADLNVEALQADMLARWLRGASPTDLEAHLRRSQQLPHGTPGQLLFEGWLEEVRAFADRLQRHLPDTWLNPLEVDVTVGGWRVVGRLEQIAVTGHLGYQPRRVTPQDYLELWLIHLLLNQVAPPSVTPQSRWLGLDRELVFSPVADSRPLLADLLALYGSGLRAPIHFFPATSLAYLRAEQGGDDNPEQSARRVWEGENRDPYYQLAFRSDDPLDEAFLQQSTQVYHPLLAHLKEIP